ncbi:hypothetical protein J4401_02510 [Candidatus Woesearchaeota archaeon]|nr:hypothetical protein [Candidatus Woesearchaeota archaeon]
MKQKRRTNEKELEKLVLFALVGIIVFYVFTLAGTSGRFSGTGSAYDGKYSLLIETIRGSPERYTAVIGTNAQEYEREYAEKIASHLGIALTEEKDISASGSLVVIGSPGTNMLMDELIEGTYSGEPSISLSGSNILIAFDSREDAERALGMVTGQPSFSDFVPWTVMTIVVAIPIILLLFEARRKHGLVGIANKKTEAIRDYVNKYQKRGYTKEQVREGLLKYGYPEKVIDSVLSETKNA